LAPNSRIVGIGLYTGSIDRVTEPTLKRAFGEQRELGGKAQASLERDVDELI
jgi:hypothetical protein